MALTAAGSVGVWGVDEAAEWAMARLSGVQQRWLLLPDGVRAALAADVMTWFPTNPDAVVAVLRVAVERRPNARTSIPELVIAAIAHPDPKVRAGIGSDARLPHRAQEVLAERADRPVLEGLLRNSKLYHAGIFDRVVDRLGGWEAVLPLCRTIEVSGSGRSVLVGELLRAAAGTDRPKFPHPSASVRAAAEAAPLPV